MELAPQSFKLGSHILKLIEGLLAVLLFECFAPVLVVRVSGAEMVEMFWGSGDDEVEWLARSADGVESLTECFCVFG